MSSIEVRVVPHRDYFCDLSLSLDRRDEKVLQVTNRLKLTSWNDFVIGERVISVDKSIIPITLELAVLEALRHDPLSILSEKEERVLEHTKSFETKTKFYLGKPGASMLLVAALLSAFAGGMGYYYGVKMPEVDPIALASMFALATLVGAVASNFLGFYITGILPHQASNADNAEQNMWEKVALCKIKPAAYQMLAWYSPELKPLETVNAMAARRLLALCYADTLKLDEIVSEFKAKATQPEKIDVAFGYLYEAFSLIKMQQSFEAGALGLSPISGEMSFVAKMLGYFR